MNRAEPLRLLPVHGKEHAVPLVPTFAVAVGTDPKLLAAQNERVRARLLARRPPEGHDRAEHLVLVREVVERAGIDDAAGDRVRTDPARCELDGEIAHDAGGNEPRPTLCRFAERVQVSPGVRLVVQLPAAGTKLGGCHGPVAGSHGRAWRHHRDRRQGHLRAEVSPGSTGARPARHRCRPTVAPPRAR